MLDIDKCVYELKRAILDSDEYKEFRHYLELVKKEPPLYDMVCDLRRQIFYVNNNDDINGEQYKNDVSKLSSRYNEIMANDTVVRFMESELTMCRLIQDINLKLVEDIDFDISFMDN